MPGNRCRYLWQILRRTSTALSYDPRSQADQTQSLMLSACRLCQILSRSPSMHTAFSAGTTPRLPKCAGQQLRTYASAQRYPSRCNTAPQLSFAPPPILECQLDAFRLHTCTTGMVLPITASLVGRSGLRYVYCGLDDFTYCR